MVEEAAQDYSKILQSVDVDREINPLCTNIEDMLARLDEFETLLANVKAENNGILENHICSINNFGEQFNTLCESVDKLEQFVNIINAKVDELEKSVDIAEEELNVSGYSIKGLILKPLLAKTKVVTHGSGKIESARSNLKNGEYQRIPIYETKHFFDS